MGRTVAIVGALLLAGPAQAGRGRELRHALDVGPAAHAGEIPALAELLERTGWEPTPELSGAFRAGYLFQATEGGHRLQLEDCFAVEPTVSTYTAAEVVTRLQAGVSVRAGIGGGGLEGGLVKKMSFSTPEHVALPALKLVPTAACRETLAAAARAGADLGAMYVVQEVLTARIAEQTCGRIDASGSFVGLGSAEAELALACSQESLEPVAIAYRTTPVAELLEAEVSVASWTAPPVGREPRPEPTGGPEGYRPVPPTSDLQARLWTHLPLYFAPGGSRLSRESEPELDAIAALLVENPAVRVRIGVHTDDVGADVANLGLSQERADAVRAALASRGVGIHRLEAVGYGETRPVASNRTEEGRARNRRVEIHVVEEPG